MSLSIDLRGSGKRYMQISLIKYSNEAQVTLRRVRRMTTAAFAVRAIPRSRDPTILQRVELSSPFELIVSGCKLLYRWYSKEIT